MILLLLGKHGNNVKVDDQLIQDIRHHINSIPRIDSHYLIANTSRQYIEEGKTITDLHRLEIVDNEKKDLAHKEKHLDRLSITENK